MFHSIHGNYWGTGKGAKGASKIYNLDNGNLFANIDSIIVFAVFGTMSSA